MVNATIVQGVSGTHRFAGTAIRALVPITDYLDLLILIRRHDCGSCVCGTYLSAFEATDALDPEPEDLGLKSLRFRAMAPEAFQRTALEKNGLANPRPVMY
jgi:hypothetical protein